MAHKKQKKMRSPLDQEMHKYAPLLTSTVSDSKPPKDKCSGSRNEKYSLRERQKRRHVMASMVDRQKHQNNRGDAEVLSNLGTKSTSCNSGKSKAPPLSKYRRKTANARERTRMREINTAFETLRHCVPQVIAGDDAGVTNEKLTKITTLRLAMKYISLLTMLLENPDFPTDFPLDFLDHAQYDFAGETAASGEESESFTETKQQAKIEKSAAKPSAAKAGQQVVRKAPKRLSKKRKLPDSEHSVESISTNASSSCSSTTSACIFNTRSASTTPCTASPSFCFSSHRLDNIVVSSYSSSSNIFQSMSALNNLVLESDGESLHLSEHCLSPVQDKYAHLFSSSDSNPTDDISIAKDHNPSDLYAIESPLELNLQLMESSPNSIDFSMEQPPTACMSPLTALDTFSPFGDFLPDYPEHTSLDLFLT